MLKETFEWSNETKSALPIPKERLIKLISKTSAPTIHPDDPVYPIRRFNNEELRRAARTLISRPIGLNHDHVIPNAYVLDSEYSEPERQVESIGVVPQEWLAKIRSGKVRNCSVEYTWRNETRNEADQSVEFEGLVFTRVDLLEGLTPGDKNSTVKLYESGLPDKTGMFVADILLTESSDNVNLNGKPAPEDPPKVTWVKPDLGHMPHLSGADVNGGKVSHQITEPEEGNAKKENKADEAGSGTELPVSQDFASGLSNSSETVNPEPKKAVGSIVPVPTGEGKGNPAQFTNPLPPKINYEALYLAEKTRVVELTEALHRVQAVVDTLKVNQSRAIKSAESAAVIELRHRVEAKLPNGGFIHDQRLNRFAAEIRRALYNGQ
jgi:hypothetical protein